MAGKESRKPTILAARAALLRRREARIVAFQEHRCYEVRLSKPEPRTLHEAILSNQGWDSDRIGEPTETRPGTLERIEVYRLRVEQGLSLWNPADRVQDVFWEKLAEEFGDRDDDDDWGEYPCGDC